MSKINFHRDFSISMNEVIFINEVKEAICMVHPK